MNPFRRFARGNVHLSRLHAFSDGVFAIVVTLLVLELKVPRLGDHHSAHELAERLRELAPVFLSWLISFVIVCKFWLNHSHVLGLVSRANYGLAWLNSLFLMAQAFIPFPTAMMGEYPTNPLAVSFFGVVMAANTVLFIVLHAYVLRRLLAPELAGTQDPRVVTKSFVGVASYLVGAGAAWLSVHAAFAMYLVTPLFFIVPTPAKHDRPTGAGAAPASSGA
jgi:uncharacterized membrane protein